MYKNQVECVLGQLPLFFFYQFLPSPEERQMRILNSFASLAAVVPYLTRGVVAGGYTDTCAQITNRELQVPQPLFPKILIPVGLISEFITPFPLIVFSGF